MYVFVKLITDEVKPSMEYQVWCPDLGDDEDMNGAVYETDSAENAAIEWAGDYDVEREYRREDDDLRCLVSVCGEDGSLSAFKVFSKCTFEYHVSLVDNVSDGQA